VVRVGPSGALVGPATLLPPPTLSVDDVDRALDAALAGVGVAILPRWLVAESLASGTLVRVVPDAPEFSAPVVAVYPSRRSMPRRVRMLLDHCAAPVSAMLDR
jgi:DNA-binding transcriptional LysR family regulator